MQAQMMSLNQAQSPNTQQENFLKLMSQHLQ